MNESHDIWSLRLLAGLVSIFCGIFAFALFTENRIMFESAKIAVVPVLLTLYFARMKYMANLFLSVFLFLFIGEALSIANQDFITNTISKSSYLVAYGLLMLILISKLKRVKFEGLVALYLVFVCLLNTYFFYIFYDVIHENFKNSIDLSFYIIRSALLIAMCFLAFTVYLNNETKQSILFLSMSFCFVFANVLHYVTNLYVYYWFFDWIGSALNVVGLFVLLSYVTNHNRKSHPFKLWMSKESEDFKTIETS